MGGSRMREGLTRARVKPFFDVKKGKPVSGGDENGLLRREWGPWQCFESGALGLDWSALLGVVGSCFLTVWGEAA